MKISKFDKAFYKLTKRQGISILIQLGDITIDTEEIERITRTYFKDLNSTKLENIKEIDNFLNTYHYPKLNQN